MVNGTKGGGSRATVAWLSDGRNAVAGRWVSHTLNGCLARPYPALILPVYSGAGDQYSSR